LPVPFGYGLKILLDIKRYQERQKSPSAITGFFFDYVSSCQADFYDNNDIWPLDPGQWFGQVVPKASRRESSFFGHFFLTKPTIVI
jgi:hypothetical protein